MAKKPISKGLVWALGLFGAFYGLVMVGMLALAYYARVNSHPGVALSDKPGPEEAQLFLDPGELAGLGLLPSSAANDQTPTPTVDLKRNSYQLDLAAAEGHGRVIQTLLFQKGYPALNKAMADLVSRALLSKAPDKPGIGHDRFTVGKAGAEVDAWSKNGRCYYLSVWTEGGLVMLQMRIYQPLAVPDHAALGAAVDGELERVGAYAAKHPKPVDGPKLP